MDRLGLYRMDDLSYIKLQFKDVMGQELDIENPTTFNEKLQWLKLYDKNPKYTKMVDKYEAKKYAASIIGEEYIIPTLGVYDKFEDIDFEKLPNQFVMKCTHDSGGIVICKDKANLDIQEAKKKVNKYLKRNYFYNCREWPYKNVKPRIIVEEYMEDSVDKELRDYKFYCFNGYVKSLMVATDRLNAEKELCFDYFDENFKHLNLVNELHPNAKIMPHKPKQFEKMKELARKLSLGFPHLRVDFYEANGQIYFGEVTFYDMGAYLKIKPESWEKEWGNLIKLPNSKETK